MVSYGDGVGAFINLFYFPKSYNDLKFWEMMTLLTRISLASLLWDIGKQNSPRCDAAEHGKWNTNSKSLLMPPKLTVDSSK